VAVFDTTGIHTVNIGGNYRKLLTVVDDSWDAVQNFPLDKHVDLAAWHGTVPGISFEGSVKYSKNEKLNDFLKKSKCKYFALGDIHKHLQLATNCWYPGALVQKTYGCEEGMLLVSIADDSVHAKPVHLDLPKRINLPLTFEIGKDSETSIVSFVKDNYSPKSLIRLIFNLPVDVWASLNKESIKSKLVEFEDVKLDNIIRVEDTKRKNLDNMRTCKTLDEEIKMIVDSEELDVDKEELLKVCKELSCS
jgi:hypothetical protein